MNGKKEVSIEVVSGNSKDKEVVASYAISDVFLPTALSCRVVTERSYQKQLSYFFQELGNQPLTMLREAISAFVGEERASWSTRRLRKYAMLKYFKTVVENPLERYEIVDFIQQLEIPKQVTRAISKEKYLTKEQVEKIRKLDLTPKQRAVFNCLYETGMRASELTNIKISDIKASIEEDAEGVSVITILGKGNKVREVYLDDSYVSQARVAFGGSTYLIEGANGKPLSHHSLYAIVKAIGKKAGITRKKTDKNGNIQKFKNGKEKIESALHPHMLRHTFATLSIEAKVDTKALSEYLGHSKTAITEDFYIHTRLSAKDFKVRK